MNTALPFTTSKLLITMLRNVKTPRKFDQSAARVDWYRRANGPQPGETEYAKVAHVAVLSDS